MVRVVRFDFVRLFRLRLDGTGFATPNSAKCFKAENTDRKEWDSNFMSITRRHRRSNLGCEELENRIVPQASASGLYVGQLYTSLLHRTADPVGLSFWSGLIDAGVSRDQVAQDIEMSLEYRNDVVQQIYEKDLHRSADLADLTGWTALLQTESAEQVQAGILGSTEFFQDAGGTDGGFLVAVYQDVLNRALDSSGAATFGLELASGMSREAVAYQVLCSTEYRIDLVESYYSHFLHRGADLGGLESWVGQGLAAGMSDQDVIAGFVSSPEFESSSTPSAPTVNSPGSAVTSKATSFDITGTAESGSLVHVYRGSTVVGSEQLAGSETNFSVTVPLKNNTVNSFDVTATNALGIQSARTTVPPITQHSGAVTVTAPAKQKNNEGDSVNLPVVASDANSLPLSFDAAGLPAGLTIGTTTGIIAGTIAQRAAAASPYTVTVRATDGASSETVNFVWRVSTAPPTITAPANQINVNGDDVSGLKVVATGISSGTITYSASNLPPGVQINGATGVISGTISSSASHKSPYEVTVSATQNSQTTSATFSWNVTTSSSSTLPFSLTSPAWETLPSGVRFQDLTVGTGAAVAAGDTINVDYVGYLTDGTVFNSGNGFSAALRKSKLIVGWVDGVPGMKLGGVRLLDIPSSLAYGANPPSGIPSDAELVFKITLNSFTG
jgi:FKBP-type peptidyl-prolyl cis-trans isomerase